MRAARMSAVLFDDGLQPPPGARTIPVAPFRDALGMLLARHVLRLEVKEQRMMVHIIASLPSVWRSALVPATTAPSSAVAFPPADEFERNVAAFLARLPED